MWVDIPNFEGLYACSKKGEIKSYDRITINKRGTAQSFKGRILKPKKTKQGYLAVVLVKDSNRYNLRVNRIIATVYLANPENKPDVNHKDCNKINNSVNNLEWVTKEENMQHAELNGLVKRKSGFDNKRSKPIICFDLSGNILKEYGSKGDAARDLNISRGNITNVLRGKCQQESGFIFKYL